MRVGTALAAALLLVACDERAPTAPPGDAVCPAAPGSSAAPAFQREISPPLDSIFADAAREFDVPVALLKAISWVETRWQMVEGHPEFGQPAAAGVMALRETVIERGAQLAGVTPAEARLLPDANVRAGAALLRERADLLEIDRSDLAAWAPAVAWYSGIDLPAGRASYVHDDVYAVLRSGAEMPGVARLAAVSVNPLYPALSFGSASASVDHAGAIWRPSPNHNARPDGEIGRVAMVIIHSCEGSYTGCWSWLADPVSQVSAHYVVKEDGSEVTQLVAESGRGWHIGSRYDCTLNAGVDCWRNGQSNNHFTIGVEHGGYASQTSWPLAQLETSARLVCDVTRRHGIARDRIRILSHAQLQPHNRTDPGAHWPWSTYLELINRYCGDDPVDDIVVDGDDAGESAEGGYLSVSSSWTRSSLTPGYHGASYHFAPTGPLDDPAVFHFHLPEPGMRTVEAWWTAGSNRSPRARYTVNAGATPLATVEVDQQRDGAAWRPLGTWHFPAGWNSVRLSREGPAGCVVIADAVRIR